MGVKCCYPFSDVKTSLSFLHSSKLTTGACITTHPGSDKSIHVHLREREAAALCPPAMWYHHESQVTHPICFLENTNKRHNYHLASLIRVQLTASGSLAWLVTHLYVTSGSIKWINVNVFMTTSIYPVRLNASHPHMIAALLMQLYTAISYINHCPPYSTKCDMV